MVVEPVKVTGPETVRLVMVVVDIVGIVAEPETVNEEIVDVAAEKDPETVKPDDKVAAPVTFKIFKFVLLPTLKLLAESSVIPAKDPPLKFWLGAGW